MSHRPTLPSKYDAANLLAARVILDDPRYLGGAMETWARMVIARLEPQSKFELVPICSGEAA